jgi:hypothetical protein
MRSSSSRAYEQCRSSSNCIAAVRKGAQDDLHLSASEPAHVHCALHQFAGKQKCGCSRQLQSILLPLLSLSLAPDWGSHSLLGGACTVK